jgi:DNA-binding transcriptional ArsR family regulator
MRKGMAASARSAKRVHRHADAAIAVLKAMGSRNRFRLLHQLVQGRCLIGALAQSLELAQVVSQRPALPRRDGVVSDACVQVLMTTRFEQFCSNDWIAPSPGSIHE